MGNSGQGHQILLAIIIALVFVVFNGVYVSTADAYDIYTSPLPSYVYGSPPPPPYAYSSQLKSRPPTSPYISSPSSLLKSPPPPYYYYTSPTTTITVGSGVVSAAVVPTYCVAKSGADQNAMLSALSWVCGKVLDCSPLQQGHQCFEPDTVAAHASFAFNLYYQQNGRLTGTCDFNGTAIVTTSDPSHGTCIFIDQWSDRTITSGSTLCFGDTLAVVLLVVVALCLNV